MKALRKQPSAPIYTIESARKTKESIPRLPITTADIERDGQKQAFKLGLILGVGIAAIVFVLVMVLWAVPTVDGAVATAKAMACGAVVA